MIKDLRVVHLSVHEDDRGGLFEAVHHYELPGGRVMPTQPGRFGQVYMVHDPVRGTVRAFHKHYKLWDFFTIVHGSAKFAFVDDRDDQVRILETSGHGVPMGIPEPGEEEIIVTSARQPKLIVVPPGVFHGWMSLEDDTLLCSVGSELYDKNDEVRVSPDSFLAAFGDDPWEIQGR